jgi:hypothetical protein
VGYATATKTLTLRQHLADTVKSLLSNLLAAAVIFLVGAVSAAFYGLHQRPEVMRALYMPMIIIAICLAVAGLAAIAARRRGWDIIVYYRWYIPYIYGGAKPGRPFGIVPFELNALRRLVGPPPQHRITRRLEDILQSYASVDEITRWDFTRSDLTGSVPAPVRIPYRAGEYPTLVWPKHLTRSRFWPNVSFSLNVLYGRESVSIVRDDSSAVLEIDLSPITLPLGIYANAGKARLRRIHERDVDPRKLVANALECHQLLMSGNGSTTFRWDTVALGPLRWPSAGVLPIARGPQQGRTGSDMWAIVHFRDIDPVGWNVSNGGPESNREFEELDDLIEREFVEEVMVLAGEPRPGGPEVESLQFRSNRGPLRFTQRYIDDCVKARLTDDRIHIVRSDPPRWLTVAEAGSPFTTRVHYGRGRRGQRESTKDYSNVYFSINGLERGIEVIRIYEFNIQPGMYFLDGELFPWKPTPPPLVRRPMMLLSVPWLREVFETGDGALGEIVAGTECKRLPPIPPTAYRPFVRDVALKRDRHDALQLRLTSNLPALQAAERQMRVAELEQLDEWLRVRDYESRFAAMVNGETIVDDELRQLCPVTWKTLELALQFRRI